MVTVIDAGVLQGYSGLDHLIEDETADIIGREYRSVGDALRASDKLAWIARHGNHPRRQHPYTWVKVQMARGQVVERQSV